MTEDEFLPLAATLRAAFASNNFMPDKFSFGVYYKALADLPVEQVNAGIEYVILTSEFPPKVATLRKACARVAETESLNAMEAWALVSKAITNGNYGAESEYAKLPVDVQKSIGNPANIREMARMDLKQLSVEQSHFINSYNAVLKRKDNDAMLPPSMLQRLQQHNNGLLEVNNGEF